MAEAGIQTSTPPPRLVDSPAEEEVKPKYLTNAWPLASSPALSTSSLQPDLTMSKQALGQFSFAPATRTTVVTTTTTTTTSFPPFSMQAPRRLKDRNPELYPLAAAPTPRAVKRLRFDIDGQSIQFEEADDPDARIQEFALEQRNLAAGHGSFTQIVTPKTPGKQRSSSNPQNASLTRRERVKRPSSQPHRLQNLSDGDEELEAAEQPTLEILRNRSATPISLSDAAELNSTQRHSSIPKSSTGLRPQSPAVTRSASDTDEALKGKATKISRESSKSIGERDLSTGKQGPEGTRGDESGASSLANSDLHPFTTFRTGLPMTTRDSIPPRINTSPLADASLPSPSLSPITASRSRPPYSLEPAPPFALDELSPQISSSAESSMAQTDTSNNESSVLPQQDQDASSLPIANIPAMLDSFDHMPDAMKSYVMFHLLKRCAKPTLKFVAETVDPAVRCDFLARLPVELGLNILSYLDARSMCSAAQVSKRWRRMVDTDEGAWKRLLVADGFKISRDEMERAVRQGWGWRFEWPSRELDSNSFDSLGRRLSDSGETLDEPPLEPTKAPQPTSRRKRKAGVSKTTSLKRQKRTDDATAALSANADTELVRALDKAHGPTGYASAAASAVPNPHIGLSSLQHLHFFKSIYQRQAILRNSWMKPNSEPLHLAFRARSRHVVTCLQFDNDKILTGSDDSHIDIYDTRTGATLKRLGGHDGGVWALEYLGDLLVSGSTDRTVRVWDMRDGSMRHVFQGHTSTVRCLQILRPVKVGERRDGRPVMMPPQPLIITGSRDSTCRIWKLPGIDDKSVIQNSVPLVESDNKYFVRSLQGHSNSVRAIAAYADTLVSGSYDAFVRVWKISTGECVHRLAGHTSKVYSVVLDYERGRCISGSMDNMVKVWSLETGSCLFNLDGHTSLVGLLDLRDDLLVSAAADATLRVWNPSTGHCLHHLTAHTGAITCFLHDGQKIISGSDRTLKMWDIESGECVRDLLTDLNGVWQIKFDERRCVAAVQREDWTYIEVLDFGACRDGLADHFRGRRVVVDECGQEIDPLDFVNTADAPIPLVEEP